MAEDLTSFATFWEFYEARRDQLVGDAVRPTALARFYAAMTAEQKTVFGSDLVAAARKTIASGSFAPIDAAQRRIGIEFARSGVTYQDVFWGLFRFRDVVFDAILREDTVDSAVMRGLLEYIEHAVIHIGGAYNETTNELVADQRKEIVALSVPVLQIAPRVLLVPLLGKLAEERIAGLTTRVLAEVRDGRADTLILDLTAITHVEGRATDVLGVIVSAVRLMGAKVIVCGLPANVASAMVDRAVELQGVTIMGDLAEAVTRCVLPVAR
jgi:anti-anti-sigma regulatory factor